MKYQFPIFLVILFSALFGTGSMTFLAGLNMPSIVLNDGDSQPDTNYELNNGLLSAFEWKYPHFTAGLAYVQMGSRARDENTDLSVWDRYHYFRVYLLRTLFSYKSASLNAAVEGGKCISGRTESQVHSTLLSRKNFNWELGLNLSLDYMLNPRYGIRGSYYQAITDGANNLPSDENWKNTSFSIVLLINLLDQ